MVLGHDLRCSLKMLNLSRRTDYGFYLLTLLAEQEDKALSLKQVATAHTMSFLYLQEIAQILRRAGFVTARRGPNGGYRLDQPARDISALDVIEALEGPLYEETCMATDSGYTCTRAGKCPSRRGLAAVTERVLNVLATTSIADLVKASGVRVKI